MTRYEQERRAAMRLRPEVEESFLPVFDGLMRDAAAANARGKGWLATRHLDEAKRLARIHAFRRTRGISK